MFQFPIKTGTGSQHIWQPGEQLPCTNRDTGRWPRRCCGHTWCLSWSPQPCWSLSGTQVAIFPYEFMMFENIFSLYHQCKTPSSDENHWHLAFRGWVLWNDQPSQRSHHILLLQFLVPGNDILLSLPLQSKNSWYLNWRFQCLLFSFTPGPRLWVMMESRISARPAP